MNLLDPNFYIERREELEAMIKDGIVPSSELEAKIFESIFDVVVGSVHNYSHLFDNIVKKSSNISTDDFLRLIRTFPDQFIEYATQAKQDNIDSEAEKQLKSKIQTKLSRSYKQAGIKFVNDNGHKPAYMFVVGYNPDNPEHNRYTSNGNGHAHCIGTDITDELELAKVMPELAKLAFKDKAFLIDAQGKIVRTESLITNYDINHIKEHMYPGVPGTNSEVFGFSGPRGTRHTAALAASYCMRNPDNSNTSGVKTVVLSEESDHLAIFSAGKLIYSTEPTEMKMIIDAKGKQC